MRKAGGQQCGAGSGNGPQQDAEGENLPRPEADGEHTGRYLEAGVAQQEGREYPAQPLIAEAELTAQLKPGERDVGAVEEGDGAEDEEPEAEIVSDGYSAIQRCNIWQKRLRCLGLQDVLGCGFGLARTLND